MNCMKHKIFVSLSATGIPVSEFDSKLSFKSFPSGGLIETLCSRIHQIHIYIYIYDEGIDKHSEI